MPATFLLIFLFFLIRFDFYAFGVIAAELDDLPFALSVEIVIFAVGLRLLTGVRVIREVFL